MARFLSLEGKGGWKLSPAKMSTLPTNGWKCHFEVFTFHFLIPLYLCVFKGITNWSIIDSYLGKNMIEYKMIFSDCYQAMNDVRLSSYLLLSTNLLITLSMNFWPSISWEMRKACHLLTVRKSGAETLRVLEKQTIVSTGVDGSDSSPLSNNTAGVRSPALLLSSELIAIRNKLRTLSIKNTVTYFHLGEGGQPTHVQVYQFPMAVDG